jgi:hypothetical protein
MFTHFLTLSLLILVAGVRFRHGFGPKNRRREQA